MRYTLKLFGLFPVLTLETKDNSSTIVYNSGGSFEIAPELVEGCEYEYEEEEFGFRRPR